MDITTKYGLGDFVWFISHKKERVEIPCGTCDSSGSVIIGQTPSRRCPDCYGRGHETNWEDTKWLPDEMIRIGQVKVEITNILKTDVFSNVGQYDPDTANQQETKYMCYETGIGSGSVYYEKDLFLTKEQALAECEERNKEKE